MNHEFWFKEYHSRHHGLFFRIAKILFQKKSRFQQIDIVESPVFGKVLLLDGLVMTTELDEFVYHEMLVHPAMILHPEPRQILIIGGGDGGTAREVIKYNEVRRVVLCEIDEEVVKASREFLPELSKSFDDPRIELKFLDGVEFVKETKEPQFDLVFVDSSDPIGPATVLYSEEFIKNLRRTLKNGGITVFQSESPFTRLDIIKDLFDKLKHSFKFVKPYLAPIPGYPDGTWSFLFASDTDYRDKVRKSPAGLKYFNEEILKASFALPNFIKEKLND